MQIRPDEEGEKHRWIFLLSFFFRSPPPPTKSSLRAKKEEEFGMCALFFCFAHSLTHRWCDYQSQKEEKKREFLIAICEESKKGRNRGRLKIDPESEIEASFLHCDFFATIFAEFLFSFLPEEVMVVMTRALLTITKEKTFTKKRTSKQSLCSLSFLPSLALCAGKVESAISGPSGDQWRRKEPPLPHPSTLFPSTHPDLYSTLPYTHSQPTTIASNIVHFIS